MPELLESINPSTGETVGSVAVTPVEDIGPIVARARAALPSWSGVGIAERGELLKPAGERLLEQAEDLGALITREMGKTRRSSVAEVSNCGKRFSRVVDEIVESLQPQEIEDRHTRSTIYYDPFGVCATIAPWNYPVSMAQWMLLPALIAGNTIVVKPSEETPLSGQAYVDILAEQLPPDVLQIIHGADQQGKALVASDVDLIAFTGSRAAGKHILAAAAPGLKRVILELGGKDPMIILADADLDAAAKFAVVSCFENAGQMCISTERIYVDEAVAEEFQLKLVDLMAEWKVGDGLEEGVRMGPMVHAEQKNHVLSHVSKAVAKGATVVAGGEGHHDGFVMPTILADVTDDMEIMREETFGPVACIRPFKDVDEAVGQANDNPYGLGATVFGRDEDNAMAVARRLDAGMIGVNRGCFGASGAPWVGAKESGYGFHSSVAGHRQFAQTRVVSRGK